MFIKFTVVLTTHRLDGFVIELPGDKFGTSIEVCLYCFCLTL